MPSAYGLCCLEQLLEGAELHPGTPVGLAKGLFLAVDRLPAGVGPVLGAGILTYLFVKAIDEYRQVDQSYTGSELFGVAVPVVLGVGMLLVGIVLMLLWRAGGHRSFFGRKLETVDPDVAAGRKVGVAAVPEEAV